MQVKLIVKNGKITDIKLPPNTQVNIYYLSVPNATDIDPKGRKCRKQTWVRKDKVIHSVDVWIRGGVVYNIKHSKGVEVVLS